MEEQRYMIEELVLGLADIVSENINKIRTSICKDFDAKEDYPELEIWEDGKMINGATGSDVLKKVSEEINALEA